MSTTTLSSDPTETLSPSFTLMPSSDPYTPIINIFLLSILTIIAVITFLHARYCLPKSSFSKEMQATAAIAVILIPLYTFYDLCIGTTDQSSSSRIVRFVYRVTFACEAAAFAMAHTKFLGTLSPYDHRISKRLVKGVRITILVAFLLQLIASCGTVIDGSIGSMLLSFNGFFSILVSILDLAVNAYLIYFVTNRRKTFRADILGLFALYYILSLATIITSIVRPMFLPSTGFRRIFFTVFPVTYPFFAYLCMLSVRHMLAIKPTQNSKGKKEVRGEYPPSSGKDKHGSAHTNDKSPGSNAKNIVDGLRAPNVTIANMDSVALSNVP